MILFRNNKLFNAILSKNIILKLTIERIWEQTFDVFYLKKTTSLSFSFPNFAVQNT